MNTNDLSNKMNICVTVNSKYVRYLYVTLTSLYLNNKKGSINLVVLQRDFTEEDKDMVKTLTEKYHNTVEFVQVPDSDFAEYPTKYMREILFRLRVPEYMPDEWDRVLLLDADLIVNGDISELYYSIFKENYFAAAPDMFGKGVVWRDNRRWYPKDRMDWTHYNTGVLLYNLEGLRRDFPRDYLYAEGLNSRIEAPTFEEELINVLFGEKGILPLQKEKWNYMPGLHSYDIREDYVIYKDNDEIEKNAHIIHFAQQNPWDRGKKTEAFRIWWKYAKKTPFYEEVLRETYWKTEEYLNSIDVSLENTESKLRDIDRLLDMYESGEFADLLESKGFKTILVYGAGRVSRIISLCLEKSNVTISCFIDKEKRGLFCGEKIIGIDEVSNCEGDAILVSNSVYIADIRQDLAGKTQIPIITIDELLVGSAAF